MRKSGDLQGISSASADRFLQQLRSRSPAQGLPQDPGAVRLDIPFYDTSLLNAQTSPLRISISASWTIINAS